MSLSEIFEKAKTGWNIRLEVNQAYDYKFPMEASVRQAIPGKQWVSVDDLKQWLKKLNEKALEIDKPSNDYAEVCKQTRQYRTLLKDVLGLPPEGSK